MRDDAFDDGDAVVSGADSHSRDDEQAPAVAAEATQGIRTTQSAALSNAATACLVDVIFRVVLPHQECSRRVAVTTPPAEVDRVLVRGKGAK